jgi:Holliday junction resolvase RusA-like endonuclease
MARVAFTVIGHPQPAGSKRALPRAGGGAPVVVDANPNAKGWKQEVALVAMQAMIDGDIRIFEGPVGLAVLFTLARPKGHYGTGINTGLVRPKSPQYPVVKPDATKLLRGVEDAMTTIVWRDDSQVVEQTVLKRYGTPEGAEVIAWEM